MYFLRDSFCLSAISLSGQRHDILKFAYRPFSKMAAENSNKLKLPKIKNVYQH